MSDPRIALALSDILTFAKAAEGHRTLTELRVYSERMRGCLMDIDLVIAETEPRARRGPVRYFSDDAAMEQWQAQQRSIEQLARDRQRGGRGDAGR